MTDTTDFDITHKLEKVDEDLRLVSGWASVVEENGVPVVDRQGDVIEPREMQKAAHDFMSDMRVGGIMHIRNKSGEPVKVGEIVDSIFFSDDIQKSLGIHLGRQGWFVTMKVTDDDIWDMVKSGVLKAFSIGGRSEIKELD